MALKIKEDRHMFYKILELLVYQNVYVKIPYYRTCLTTLYIYVLRQSFRLVNPENQMIEGWIIEVLLQLKMALSTFNNSI